MSENKAPIIKFDMKVISDIADSAFCGNKVDAKSDDNKEEEKPEEPSNGIYDNVSNLINSVKDSLGKIDAVNSQHDTSKETTEEEISTQKDQPNEEQSESTKSNNVHSIFEEIVSKIQVLDGYSDDNKAEEISKETFGMTEASGAKPMTNSDESNGETENANEEAENEEIDNEKNDNEEVENEENDAEDDQPIESSKRRKKRQIQDDDEDIVQYSDEQLKEAFELFKKNKSLPPFLMRDAVVDYARRQSLQYMVSENYDEAYKNDIAINDLLLEYSKDSGGYTTESITRNLESRIKMAKEQREASNKKYQERITQLKEKEDQKLKQLVEIHACERKQFELDCQSSEFVQRFSKPSKKLLQIRKIQKALALAHKFDEAKNVKLEGDALQRSETLQAKRRAIRYIKSSYQKLLEKQQFQISCAVENKERKIQALMGQLERENDANQNLTRQLEIRLKETKSRKISSLPPLLSNTQKKAPSKSHLRQLADYKSTQRISMLNVKLTNIQKIVGAVKPPLKPIKIV